MHSYDLTSISVSDSGTLAYVPGSNEATLQWVDRGGQATPVLSERGDFSAPRISPDGRKVAVKRSLGGGAGSELWIDDLERGSRRRLTSRIMGAAIWTPDGKSLTFWPIDASQLYSRLADGTGTARPLLEHPVEGSSFLPQSWSPDGQVLALLRFPERDIWMLPDGGEASPYLATPSNERLPVFSPDGRWLAYVSDESGQDEVYVQPYPGPGARRMISAKGGQAPLWSADGREIFYQGGAGERMMAVSFADEPRLRVGEPRLLFAGSYQSHDLVREFDVAPDGQRFLMIERPEARSVNLVLNWLDELKRLVPDE
jgi:serine/threonine-protein kinase